MDLEGLRKLKADASDTLDRLRQELNLAIEHWAVFESANGYPLGGRRKSLIEKVNGHGESWGIIKIRQLAALDTALALSRVTDHYDNGRAANRRNLFRLEHFLKMDGCESFLTNEAVWPGGASVVKELYPKVLSRLATGKQANTRNALCLRKLLRELRDRKLAHSIDEGTGELPSYNGIRDGLVLTAVLVREMSLMIEGLNWDPRFVWKQSFQKSQQFWDRYEKGFPSHRSISP